MKILVTGTEGYIGSLLAPCVDNVDTVKSRIDTRSTRLVKGQRTKLSAKTLTKRYRHITLEDLQGVDAVVHMAELSMIQPDSYLPKSPTTLTIKVRSRSQH